MNTCKLCTSKKVQEYYRGLLSGKEYIYMLCDNCQTIYLSENLSDEFLKEFYSNDSYHSNNHHQSNGYFNNREISYNNKLDTIFKGKDKNIKILDYGCGDGSFLSFLKNKGYKNIYGFEYDKSVRDELENKGITTCDLDLIDDDYFDIIVCFDVIEHIKNPQETFNTLSDKLKKGGLITYTTGIYNKYFDIVDRGYCSWINYPQHLWVFSSHSFKLLNNTKKLSLIQSGVNGVFFNSNMRIILGQIRNILFHYGTLKSKNMSEPGFPGMNGVYIYKK